MPEPMVRYRLTIEGTAPSNFRELVAAAEALEDGQVLQAKQDRGKGVSVVYIAYPGAKEALARDLGAWTRLDPDVVEYGEPIDPADLRRQLDQAKAHRQRAFGKTAVLPSEGRRP